MHVKNFTEVLGSIQLQEKVLVSDTFNLLNLCTKMKDKMQTLWYQFFIFGKCFHFIIAIFALISILCMVCYSLNQQETFKWI